MTSWNCCNSKQTNSPKEHEIWIADTRTWGDDDGHRSHSESEKITTKKLTWRVYIIKTGMALFEEENQREVSEDQKNYKQRYSFLHKLL